MSEWFGRGGSDGRAVNAAAGPADTTALRSQGHDASHSGSVSDSAPSAGESEFLISGQSGGWFPI